MSCKFWGRLNSRVKKGSYKQTGVLPKSQSRVHVRRIEAATKHARLSVKTNGSKPRKSLRNSFQKTLRENMGSVKHSRAEMLARRGSTLENKTKELEEVTAEELQLLV